MAAAAAALLLISCSAKHKLTFAPPAATGSKHAMRVGLVMEKAFCTFEHHRDPEGYVYPIGNYMCQCFPSIAQSSFRDTKVFESLDAAMASPEVDAVLVPRVVKVEIRARGVAWEKRRILVVVEWTLKERATQKTLWLATVEGRAENKIGTMFSMDGKDRDAIQAAMDDVCRKSLQSFQNAEEIRALARTLPAAGG